MRRDGRVMVLVLVAAGLMSRAPVAGGTAAWWDRRWPCRMRLVLPSSPVRVDAVPLVVSGRAILKASKRAGLPASALRVVVGGREWPCQVDERDGTGRWVADPNRRLDPDDELVFQIDLPAGPAPEVHVYFSDAPTPVPDYPTRVFFQRQSRWHKNSHAHAVLRNKALWLGMSGPKSTQPTLNQFPNHGSGTLKQLRLRRTDLVHPGRAWAWVFPRHPFACGPSVHDWTVPTCVVDGPVRKIARLSVTGFQGKTRKGKVAVDADVEHTFSLYSDGTVFDFEQRIRYRRAPAQWTVSLSGQVSLGRNLHQGVAWWAHRSAGDVVWHPGPGELEKAEKRHVSVRPNLPDEFGWCAWHDPKTSCGVACMPSRVVCSDPKAKPVVQCHGAYGHGNVMLVTTLAVHGAAKPGALVWAQRYWVFERATPAQVSVLDRAYRQGPTCGPVEKRP